MVAKLSLVVIKGVPKLSLGTRNKKLAKIRGLEEV